VVEQFRRRMVDLVESGQDVVYDPGMWWRTDRDAYKRLVEEHGGRWRLLYFKVDRDVLLQRLIDRNRRSDANVLAWSRWRRRHQARARRAHYHRRERQVRQES
jgi:predicted kinase